MPRARRGGGVLAGYRSGAYGYNALAMPTAFAALLDDAAGALWGSTLEERKLAGDGAEVSAQLTGARDGYDVELRKAYDVGQGMHEDVIVYRGTLSDDCNVIEGQWHFQSAPSWAGYFIMRRASNERRWEIRTGSRVAR